MTRQRQDRGPVGDRPEQVLDSAQICYESGAIQFRYSRYMSIDGIRWVRHGLFVAYRETGQVSSEGQCIDGLEQGIWREYHENGRLAAEGFYFDGKEHGYWRFWNPDGQEEIPVEYDHGEKVA